VVGTVRRRSRSQSQEEEEKEEEEEQLTSRAPFLARTTPTVAQPTNLNTRNSISVMPPLTREKRETRLPLV
jgi:hypothetical protein